MRFIELLLNREREREPFGMIDVMSIMPIQCREMTIFTPGQFHMSLKTILKKRMCSHRVQIPFL